MEQLALNELSENSTVNKKNLDSIVGLVEELVINKVRIEKIKNEISDNAHIKILDQELRIISEIQDSIKKVRLIKVKTITKPLEELVEKCSKEDDLRVNFSFKGQDTEIENSMIGYVHGMLSWLIKDICKNEFTESSGTTNEIQISAYSDVKNLETTIESNGKGFDSDALCRSLNTEILDLTAFSDEEMLRFLNELGITEDVEELLKLRADLISLEGSLKFESETNQFRRIKITIPLSSSIMQGMLVTIGNQTYAIPLDFIETIMNAKNINVQGFQNNGMIIHMDHVIPLLRATDLLDIEPTDGVSAVLIINANNKRAALLVDSILDQTDMVIKPKHSILANIEEFKGTTILGDGLVTLVLDIPSILRGM